MASSNRGEIKILDGRDAKAVLGRRLRIQPELFDQPLEYSGHEGPKLQLEDQVVGENSRPVSAAETYRLAFPRSNGGIQRQASNPLGCHHAARHAVIRHLAHWHQPAGDKTSLEPFRGPPIAF